MSYFHRLTLEQKGISRSIPDCSGLRLPRVCIVYHSDNRNVHVPRYAQSLDRKSVCQVHNIAYYHTCCEQIKKVIEQSFSNSKFVTNSDVT